MEIVQRDDSRPFATKDGSIIRSILDRTNSTVMHQSLAEATLPRGAATTPHRHPRAEEIYYILSGNGEIVIEGRSAAVGPNTGILIPPGACHQIRNTGQVDLVFLCCCAPPYSHEDTAMG